MYIDFGFAINTQQLQGETVRSQLQINDHLKVGRPS